MPFPNMLQVCSVLEEFLQLSELEKNPYLDKNLWVMSHI